MTTEPIGALICGPVSDTAVYGSVEGHCIECRSDILISPSGQKVLTENFAVKVLCMHCGGRDAAKDGNYMVNPAARAEINRDRKSKGLPPLTDAEWRAKVNAMHSLINLYKGQK